MIISALIYSQNNLITTQNNQRLNAVVMYANTDNETIVILATLYKYTLMYV